MELRNRLFLMMRSGDASQAGFPWFMVGTAARGRFVLQPVAVAGWLALASFVILWIVAACAIWLWGFRSGLFSAEFAILATVLVAGIQVAGFIRLVCARMAEPPRSRDQSR